jgi:catechol 2,3-dioxygenase-like lactoylglutathione lyase family enzyme
MVKERSGDPWMPADAYGRSLRGLGLNLIVRKVARAVAFHRDVLGARVVYGDPDFAVVALGGAEVMLHADHTYAKHPLHEALAGDLPRGLGAELRVHDTDPDACEARARAGGYTVLAASADKPHGLRECYLPDPDGYIWVPDRPLPAKGP